MSINLDRFRGPTMAEERRAEQEEEITELEKQLKALWEEHDAADKLKENILDNIMDVAEKIHLLRGE